jgi:hypothetical protein
VNENKNAPAFPATDGTTAFYEPGLSKREYFAGVAMQGMLANSTINQGYSSSSDWARSAVEFADALINELSKPQP